ncbi:BMC domain-containing protein [Anaerovorax sp. IOR16]|uniref:BMC domain-containing protein n=1 Tax=Anaerovorax sp. IOR16 TaxID=2773458 RepID=UPI0019D063E6|nr:BMC domain-containing protein [Anaerovorax sp. IOR16]
MLKSLGLIEAIGLTAAITAADAAVKSANVTLVGYELVKGSGRTVIKVEGDVGAVKAAIEAASAAALTVGRVAGVKVIARPSDGLESMIRNRQTVGYHLAPVLHKKETVSLDKPAEIQASQAKSEILSDSEVSQLENLTDSNGNLLGNKETNSNKILENEDSKEIIAEQKNPERKLSNKEENKKSETKPKSSQKKTTKKSGTKVTK